MTHGLFLIADGEHRVFAAECSKVAGSAAAVTVGDDGANLQLRSGLYRLLGKESRYIVAVFVQRNTDVVIRQFVFFRLGGNFRHCLDGFNRIFAVSRLTAQHQSIRTVIDGVGDVGNFRTGRTRIGNHGMKHLRGNDNRLLGKDTFANQQTLDARNTFLRNFDTQVATGYHNAVGHFENLVDIVHTFLVLNLGNDSDVAVVGIEDSLYIQNILSVAHERVSDEVDVFLDGVEDIVAVFFRQ